MREKISALGYEALIFGVDIEICHQLEEKMIRHIQQGVAGQGWIVWTTQVDINEAIQLARENGIYVITISSFDEMESAVKELDDFAKRNN